MKRQIFVTGTHRYRNQKSCSIRLDVYNEKYTKYCVPIFIFKTLLRYILLNWWSVLTLVNRNIFNLLRRHYIVRQLVWMSDVDWCDCAAWVGMNEWYGLVRVNGVSWYEWAKFERVCAVSKLAGFWLLKRCESVVEDKATLRKRLHYYNIKSVCSLLLYIFD